MGDGDLVASPTAADGRTARRDRNRDAVLDAVLALFEEDSLTPSPADVAERSGVSLRSVYRYYDDMDELVRAAIARHLARMEPLFVLPDPGVGPLDERIDRLVEARLRLYEAAGPMARASVARAATNELIRERLEDRRRVLRSQVEEMFAPELAAVSAREAHDAVAAIDVLLELESADHLRRHRGLSEEETTRILAAAVRALVPTAP